MGRRLQQARQALGLSQDELAAVLGIGTTTLSAWETGRNRIDIVKLARAAARFGFTLDWIALGSLAALPRGLAERIEALASTPDKKRRGRPPKPPREGRGAPEPHPAPAPPRLRCVGC